jgi:hypothetical protein
MTNIQKLKHAVDSRLRDHIIKAGVHCPFCVEQPLCKAADEVEPAFLYCPHCELEVRAEGLLGWRHNREPKRYLSILEGRTSPVTGAANVARELCAAFINGNRKSVVERLRYMAPREAAAVSAYISEYLEPDERAMYTRLLERMLEI